MIRVVAMLAAMVSTISALPSSFAVDIDRTAVDFTTPAEIKRVRNKAGTKESAVLFGDPTNPGPMSSASGGCRET